MILKLASATDQPGGIGWFYNWTFQFNCGGEALVLKLQACMNRASKIESETEREWKQVIRTV